MTSYYIPFTAFTMKRLCPTQPAETRRHRKLAHKPLHKLHHVGVLAGAWLVQLTSMAWRNFQPALLWLKCWAKLHIGPHGKPDSPSDFHLELKNLPPVNSAGRILSEGLMTTKKLKILNILLEQACGKVELVLCFVSAAFQPDIWSDTLCTPKSWMMPLGAKKP